jgi:WD40 repeat protein
MAISPNGNQIVFGSKEDVRIWDRQSKNAYHLHSGNISGVAWSADGRVFASVGEDGRLVVWTPGGKVRYEMLRPSKFASVAFSPIDPKGGTLQLACANDNGTIYLIRLGDAPVAAPPANADKPTGIPTSYSPGKLWQALTGRI